MAEESADNEETYGGQAELTDAELNALFEELRLDIPDPPSTFQDDWVMGELILDPEPAHCEYVMHTEQGQVQRVCTMHEEDCDSYTHAVWRAACGRDVRTLVQCTWHIDRLTGYCRLCMVEDGTNTAVQRPGHHSYRGYQQLAPEARGQRSRRIKRRIIRK